MLRLGEALDEPFSCAAVRTRFDGAPPAFARENIVTGPFAKVLIRRPLAAKKRRKSNAASLVAGSCFSRCSCAASS